MVVTTVFFFFSSTFFFFPVDILSFLFSVTDTHFDGIVECITPFFYTCLNSEPLHILTSMTIPPFSCLNIPPLEVLSFSRVLIKSVGVETFRRTVEPPHDLDVSLRLSWSVRLLPNPTKAGKHSSHPRREKCQKEGRLRILLFQFTGG